MFIRNFIIKFRWCLFINEEKVKKWVIIKEKEKKKFLCYKDKINKINWKKIKVKKKKLGVKVEINSLFGCL